MTINIFFQTIFFLTTCVHAIIINIGYNNQMNANTWEFTQQTPNHSQTYSAISCIKQIDSKFHFKLLICLHWAKNKIAKFLPANQNFNDKILYDHTSEIPPKYTAPVQYFNLFLRVNFWYNPRNKFYMISSICLATL